ncbi:MAG: Ldh family oxidoreductase [Candidatus Sulfotelmatobacter sp.]
MALRRYSIEEAVELAERTLVRIGIPIRDSLLIAKHLVAAELHGYPGHGFRRMLRMTGGQKAGAATQNAIKIKKTGFLLVDGQGRMGIAAVADAIDGAIQELENSVTTTFGVLNYSGTTGSLGVYASDISRRGVTSILMCNSEFAVAPYGSSRAVLGTNPIAISMPGHPAGFLADVATAAWSYGSIRDAGLAGRELPAGVVQTEDGYPSTDPQDADRGSQLPMAGHKGYALGLAIELLCGALIGGKCGRDSVTGSDGFLGVLVRTDAARTIDAVNSDMQKLFAEIRSGPISPVHREIRIPGEGWFTSGESSRYVDISENLLRELAELKTKE